MLFIGGVALKIIALAFVSGLAYVLTYIDGVGAISRYQTEAKGFINAMYAMSQMVNWWGAAAWAVFIFALIKRKSWTIPMGVFAASMSMFGGFPVGITDVVIQGRFSMFLVAPVISMGLLIYLLLPGTKKMIAEWQNS
jgi:ABC-type transport system involved in multi-copper enzyme maturation permease subunit